MAKAKEIDVKAKEVLHGLKDLSTTTMGETQKKLNTFIKQMRNVFKYSSQISTEVLSEI
jgi:hypothetical protein